PSASPPSNQVGRASGGRTWAHGWAASKAALARRQRASWWRLATIWRPTGRPSEVKPQGTVAAGQPGRLKGEGKGRRAEIGGAGGAADWPGARATRPAGRGPGGGGGPGA